jgi:hypothetical protein
MHNPNYPSYLPVSQRLQIVDWRSSMIRRPCTDFLTRPSACLPACLPTCLPACLPAYLLAYLLAYLPACLPVYLPTCLPACLPVCLPAYLCVSVRFNSGEGSARLKALIDSNRSLWPFTGCPSCLLPMSVCQL